MDDSYVDAFNACVVNRWKALDVELRTNTVNGPSRRGQLSRHDSEADALSDVIDYQRKHIRVFMNLLKRCSDHGLIDMEALSEEYGITVIDFGAGAATAGIAIRQQWGDSLNDLEYQPIEPHPAMRSIGSCLLKHLSKPQRSRSCPHCHLVFPFQVASNICPNCEATAPTHDAYWRWPIRDYFNNLSQLENEINQHYWRSQDAPPWVRRKLFFTFSYVFQQRSLKQEEVHHLAEVMNNLAGLTTNPMSDFYGATIEILATGAQTHELTNHLDTTLLPKFRELNLQYKQKELREYGETAWKRYMMLETNSPDWDDCDL